MKYLLAVDGGGTKTQFSICGLDGTQLGTFFAGSSNYKSVGTEEVYHSFMDGIGQIEKELSISKEELVCSVWGISGCDSENDYKLLNEQIRRLGFSEEAYYLCNDGLLAYYAQALAPGMVIIAGTGSIILGINEQGEIRRAGGWGYNISDIGSGYWVGAEALKKTLLYCDNCCEYSPLFLEVREYFKAESFEELPYIITEMTDYFEIAKVAALVTKLSAQGEAVSRKILKKGAKVLAALAKSTYERLGFDGDTRFSIVFSGGALKNEEYQKLLKADLEKQISLKNVSFFTQKNAPVCGGIKLAQRIAQKGREGL